jgi:hypothetical protein
MYVHEQHDLEKAGPPGAVKREFIGIAGREGGRSWNWINADRFSRVIRYRIRKPAAMQALINIAANPAPMPEEIDA